MCTTASVRCTWCCHSCAGRPLETEPSGAKTAITIIVVPIRSPSSSTAETSVVPTFWPLRRKRTTVARHWITFCIPYKTEFFFSGFVFATYCKSCVYNCDDLLLYNSSPRSSRIWFSVHNFITFLAKYNFATFHYIISFHYFSPS